MVTYAPYRYFSSPSQTSPYKLPEPSVALLPTFSLTPHPFSNQIFNLILFTNNIKKFMAKIRGETIKNTTLDDTLLKSEDILL